MPRIALALDDHDWHARALIAAFAALGAELIPFRLAQAELGTTSPHGVSLPGFGDALPDAVLVRAVAGGSFEEVTRRLGVLHALRALGVPAWNDARAIERCVDKSATAFALAHAGLPTPPTWTVEGQDAARAIVAREPAGGMLVLKPLFGSQGRGLRLVAGPDDLPHADAVGGIYHLQRFVPAEGDGFADHRLFVCGGEVIGAMTRRAANWVTNIRQGGKPEALAPGPGMVDLAIRAAASVGAAYAGVDLLRGRDGRDWVLEVNSMPGWRGLQRVTAHSIAARLAAALLAGLR